MGVDQLIFFYSTSKSSRLLIVTLAGCFATILLPQPSVWAHEKGGAGSELAMVHASHIGIWKGRERLEWGSMAKSNLR